MSTEGPRFRTLAIDSMMVVIQVPLHPPTLTVSSETLDNNEEENEGKDLEEVFTFEAGASLNVQCASDLSHPRPNVSIFINNILLNEQNTDCYREESKMTGFLQKGIVTVGFHLNEDFLGYSWHILKIFYILFIIQKRCKYEV